LNSALSALREDHAREIREMKDAADLKHAMQTSEMQLKHDNETKKYKSQLYEVRKTLHDQESLLDMQNQDEMEELSDLKAKHFALEEDMKRMKQGVQVNEIHENPPEQPCIHLYPNIYKPLNSVP
jgi:hypothetical protein